MARSGQAVAPASPSAPEGAADDHGNVLELRGAAVRVGGVTLWSGVDLAVGAGEFVAVLGPNGVGKTTLLKVLLGLLPVAEGQVTVLGEPAGRANSRIGYLPQRRSFDHSSRIRGTDVVRLGLDGDRWGVPLPFGRRHRDAVRRVTEVIGLVGAGGYAGRPIGECSGGEQQRLLIAQALTRLYQTPVEVLRTAAGHLVVVGQPEAPAVHADRHATRGAP